ncbi:peptidoglycan DD-metalloendopeptidase family protein [Streptomyces sp. NBC_00715]|uniref:peptidoglycan DD-metalloendopeptidase family protein n=1 Tax=Streptomyces sp. NBC_00715 TaxID=2975811 RepID=UPI0038662982
MAEPTVVGRTRVSITPDTSKVGATLLVELPKAVRPGAIAAGDVIADTLTRKVNSAVAKLKPVVKLGLDLDVTGVKAQLDKLTAARTIKLGVDVDEGTAKQKLDRLTADRRVKVTAELDDKAATTSLTRLTADRTVKLTVQLDEAGAKQRLQGILGQRTVDILPKVQQAAYNTAVRQLDRLTADRVVNIRASVDTRVAANEIRGLIQRRVVRIGADVDTRVAADDLAVLTRRRQMTIQARADTAGATAALRLATRDRTVNVRVRSTGLAALTGSLGSIGSSSGGGRGGLASLTGTVLKLTTVIASSLPTLASFGQALIQMGPLAATAAPGLALLLGGFAALKVGLSGVGDAVKAAFTPVAGEAKAAATATKQVESAQRGLANAQRGVTDAERQLSQAQRAATQAQNELSVARRQATRDLADMNAQLKQGRLDQKQAALDVQQAEVDLQAVRSDPAASQLQIQQADLALQRAKASAEEQTRQQKRLETDTKAANKAGVDGSDQVVQARERIRQANEQVATQERAVADAHRAVADAARQVTDAHQRAATQTSKLDTALSKLSPNARAFVGTLRDMAPAWRAMKLDVQDRLFAGVGTRLGQVGGQILPTVRRGLVGIAGELNLTGKNALTAVSNLQRSGTLGKVFDGVRSSLGNLSRVPGQLVTGFAQLSVAAQPAFDRITKGAGSAMDRVMDKLGKAFKDGRLEKAINTALDVAIQFGHVLGDLGGIFAGIFKAASAAGGDFFGVVGAAIKEIRKVIQMPEVQAALTSIFKALNAVAKLLAGALGSALLAVLPLLAAIAPVVQQLATSLMPVVSQLFESLGKALMPIIKALLPVIVNVVDVIGGLVIQLLPLLAPLGALIAAIVTALAPVIKLIGSNLKVVVGAIVQLLVPVIAGLIPVVKLVGDMLAQLVPLFAQMYPALLPLIPPLLQLSMALLDLGVQILIPLMPLIVGVSKLLTGMLAVSIKAMVPAIALAVGALTTFVNGVTDGVKWIVDQFKWVYNKLLGHSIIPDIVNGTVSWFKSMWRFVRDIIRGFKDGVVGTFRALKDTATSIWRGFWGSVVSLASGAWKAIRSGVSTFSDKMQDAFRGMRDSIGSIWKGIQSLVKAPIKFWIETVYNKGIVSVWNATAAHIPGVHELDPMKPPKGFARGGVLPGYSTFRDGDDQLVPMRRGEGVYVSEAMRDPYERARLHAVNQAAMQGRSLSQFRGFAGGGIFGDIGSGIKGIGSGIADGVGSVLKKGADTARGAFADLAASAFKPVKKGITSALGSNKNTWNGMVAGAPISLIDSAIDYIRGKDSVPASGRWIKPVKAGFGTRFGARGSMWSSGRHTGLDFPAPTGTKVVAVDNGTVSKVQSGGPYGKHVTVNHGGGLSSLYAHMSAMVARAGDAISQGARVGSVGATGNVTGPHLHLEARINGRSVDPMPYLTGGDPGGSGVQRWKGVVQQVLGQVHQSLSLTNTTLRRMNQESGGNPRAVNRNDINWQQGHPSVGLMQVIEGTFKHYAGKYRRTGPFLYGVSTDPTANIFASMKYALANYGSLSRAYNRPGGYALGGIVRFNRGGTGGGYASGGIIKVGGKRIDTGPIAASVGGDFLKSLAGTAAAIDSAMAKVATAIKNAFKGVKTTVDDKLLAKIKTQTKALDTLAKARDAIAAKITAANQLAADATGQAVNFTALTSLPNGGNTFDASGILGGLNVRLGQLKAFGKNLQILNQRGLNKTLLQQIITAGPEQGAAYAQALVDATPAQLKDINTTQDAITKATGQFGKDAADAMYDAGANSGKGYLTGLASTQKLIEAQMAKIAKAVQKSIKVELKIKSPSRVLRSLGQFTGLGYSQGVEDMVPRAARAAARMAGAVRASAGATYSRMQNSQTVNQGGDRHLHYSAAVTEVASRKSILDALAVDDMLNRTVMAAAG